MGASYLKSQNLILIIAVATSFLLAPSLAGAHTPPWTIPTYIYLTASPNPVSPNQQTQIFYWLDIQPPTATSNSGGRWQNVSIEVSKPDGSIIRFGNLISDPSGSGYISYVPDQIGTYTATVSFPEQQLSRINPNTGILGPNSVYVNDTYLASEAKTTITVQQTQTSTFEEPPLPISYWTRPIDSNLQSWSAIASSWLGQSEFGTTFLKYQRYGWAPGTSHVVWTYPLAQGGIVGGGNSLNEGANFYSGLHRTKFSNPVILYGTVYFSLPLGNSPTGGGVTAVDLRTGVTKWTNSAITSIAFGQLYDYESPNERGIVGGYLWYPGTAAGTGITNPSAEAVAALSTTYASGTIALNSLPSTTNATQIINTPNSWIAVDSYSGRLLFNETNVPSGTRAYGPRGEWLIYSIGRQNNTTPFTYLWQWNNTKLPGYDVPIRVPAWEPGIANYNMSTAYDWNVTLSESLKATSNQFGSFNPTIVYVFPGNVIFGQSSGLQLVTSSVNGAFGSPDPYTLWAINLNTTRAPIGQVLWQKTYPAPLGNESVEIGPADPDTNIFTLYYRETMQWNGYDLLTGQQIWGPPAPETPLNYYSGVGASVISPYAVGYGRLYSTGYSGTVYSYDLKTGTLVFTYGNDLNNQSNSTRTGEASYGAYPLQIAAVANNKLYLVTVEHTLNSPPYQGGKTIAIDALSGKELWKITGMSSSRMSAVADGYFVWLNVNDMQVYATGPGPSATTVSAPDIAIPAGTPIVIKGTVTDQSPLLKGTPAISDADQSPWIEYNVQHTAPKPKSTGVPIKLTAVDSENKTIDIGIVVSDSNGIFRKLWTPLKANEYTIKAEFEGTQSYGPSSAATSVIVTSVITATATPSIQSSQVSAKVNPGAANEASNTSPEIGVFLALITIVGIVVVGALILFALKRK